MKWTKEAEDAVPVFHFLFAKGKKNGSKKSGKQEKQYVKLSMSRLPETVFE